MHQHRIIIITIDDGGTMTESVIYANTLPVVVVYILTNQIIDKHTNQVIIYYYAILDKYSRD